MVEILLFGQFQIQHNGKLLTLRDSKSVALIGYLALEGKKTRDHLADVLWGDRGQTEARRYLRQCVYEIRKRLPMDIFETLGDTISLQEFISTDINKFFNDQSDENVMQYYQGTFLENCELENTAFLEWRDNAREKLQSKYVAALRRIAKNHEEQGNIRGALDAHEKILNLDEFEEFHQYETIRLLQILGEYDLAITKFEQYQKNLRQELHQNPMPQTQQLVEQIRLTLKRASINKTSNSTQEVVEFHTPLIGREQQWEQIQNAKNKLTLIIGEPGIGKTRLASEYLNHNQTKYHILKGREGSSNSPLYPVAEALRQALQEPVWLEQLEPIWFNECARLIPEIDPQNPSKNIPELEGRVRFLEGLTQALILSLNHNGTIFFDDLQWHDAISLELLAHMVRATKNSNIQILATARNQELEHNQNAIQILNDLKREKNLIHVELQPLEPTEIRTLIQVLSGGMDTPNFTQTLHQITAGNPFFILETLREMQSNGNLKIMADGIWTTPYDQLDYAQLPIPSTVSETILQRINRIGKTTRRILEAASLVNTLFEPLLVSSITDLSEWDVLNCLEEAQKENIILATNTGFGFRHDLIREVLYQQISVEKKRLIHRKIGLCLNPTTTDPALIAEHLELGGLNTKAAEIRILAAEKSTRIFAYNTAIIHYQKAIENGLVEEKAFNVFLARTQLWRALDNWDAWETDLQKIQNLAETHHRTDWLLIHALEKMELLFQRHQFEEAVEITSIIISTNSITPNQLVQATIFHAYSLSFMGFTEQGITKIEITLEHTNLELVLAGRLELALADLLITQRNTKLAQKINNNAQKKFMLQGNKIMKARCIGINALIAAKEQHFEVAIKYMTEFYEASSQLSNPALQQEALLRLTEYYLALNWLEQALESLNQLEVFIAKTKNKRVIADYYLQRIDYAHRTKDQKNIEQYIFKVISLLDSTFPAQIINAFLRIWEKLYPTKKFKEFSASYNQIINTLPASRQYNYSNNAIA